MSYIEPIKEAFLFFPLIAILFTAPYIIYGYHKYGSINLFRTLIIYSFILYLMTSYFLVILPLPKKEEVEYIPNIVRLIPFEFISDIIKETNIIWNNPKTYLTALKNPAVYTVVFNLFMTMPFGMYLRYYFKCNKKKTILYTFLLSLFFEITQLTGLYFYYPYPYRVFDVDDLIINTLGGLIGYYVMGLLTKFLPSREEIDQKSKEVGKIVSGLRRITIFVFDLFLYLFSTLFVNIFLNPNHVFIFTFIIYYILIPYLLDGTIGMRFLKVRINFTKNKLLKTTIRILFLFFYYIFLPYLILLSTNFFIKELNVTTHLSIYLYLLIMILLFLFYLLNSILLLKNKTIYYDTFLKYELESTIQ